MPNDGIVELNNFLQAKGQLTSLTWEERPTGLAHAPQWICVCKINGEPRGTGSGTHKHLAKSDAAKEALKFLTGESE
ncbi:hypothetical protein JAAARDRAFT_29030 [Jaapia argillacea MUCL 33604]|uniref:DRBM domain-containing protein n=1 Tax=Jaapia argillacea MUCL 33604 TaxID=933084 RepID=A0A067Q7V4_9AGAM|nr:hypothetical protein JAAARDRAFT_29030 [Jaapia argillacea MUCL 33604]